MGYQDGLHAEIAKLGKVGITECAIRTYLVRIGQGDLKAIALTALLAGRGLSTTEVDFIGATLDRLPIQTK